MSKKNRFNFDNNNQQSEGEETMSSNILKNTTVEDEAAKETPVATAFKAPITVAATPIEPVKEAVKPVASAPAAPVKEEPVNTNINKMKNLIAGFETAVSTENVAKTNKYTAILEFIKISEFLNKNNDPAVFDYFFRWFQKNQNGIMYHETALAGIHTVQDKNVKTRLSATHSCYTELARVRSLRKGVFKFTFNAMRLMNISDAQAKWIIEKSKTRS